MQAAQQQLDGLSNLLLLQKRAREAKSLAELGFILVNETSLLLPYRNAIFWHHGLHKVPQQGKVTAATGVATLDLASPFALWAKDLCRELSQRDLHSISPVTATDLSHGVAELWPQHAAAYGLWIPLTLADGQGVGGLVLFRESEWNQAEQRILQHWASAAAHAGHSLQLEQRRPWRLGSRRRRALLLGGLGLLVATLFIPVRLSVLAPAEVVPLQPSVVRSPLAGQVESVAVQPNQAVAVGTPLMTLDVTALKTQREVASQNLELARAEFRQASQAAVVDRQAKSSLPLINLRIAAHQAELSHVEGQIARSRITASAAGVAILADADEWVGRPVKLGERLLMIAEPSQSQLQVWLPVGDDITLPEQAEIHWFANAQPDQYLTAQMTQLNFEAEVTPSGTLAYRLRAAFVAGTELPRIGQQGTARVYGASAPLYFYLFRRPAAYLRQRLGF